MIDLQIKAFENQILELVNNVPLPLAVKELVIENIYLKIVAASRLLQEKGVDNDVQEQEENEIDKRNLD